MTKASSSPKRVLATIQNDKCSPHVEQGRLAELAYTLWESRGRPPGSPDNDWFKAEQQFAARTAERISLRKNDWALAVHFL
jgi:hypothetical protein